MKSPQLENGYTRIANEILEVVSKAKFNGTQFKILIIIWRYTYGFNRKDSEFSLKFLSEATNCNKQQIKRELDKLIEKKVVIVIKESDPNISRRLSFNKKYTEWEVDGIEYSKKITVSELAYSRVLGLEYRSKLIRVLGVSGLEYQERKYKDNIKKDITTIIIADKQPETGNGNPVADIGAGPIQQDENLVAQIDADSIKQDETESVARAGADPAKQFSSVEKIEKSYLQIRKRNTCSSKDMSDMVEIYEKYKDIDFIIKTMQTVTEENRVRNGKLTINSFSYFIPVFEEAWNKLNVKKEGANNGSAPGNSKQSFKFDKSQFLWKGEGRS